MKRKIASMVLALIFSISFVFWFNSKAHAAEPETAEEIYAAADQILEESKTQNEPVDAIDPLADAGFPTTTSVPVLNVDTLDVSNVSLPNADAMPFAIDQVVGGVYPGRIGSDIINMFSSIGSLSSDYVLYRSSRYEYSFILGSIKEQGNQLVCDGQRWVYDSDVGRLTGPATARVSIEPRNGVVYSSLENYPSIVERGVYKGVYVTAVSVCVMFMFSVFMRLVRR